MHKNNFTHRGMPTFTLEVVNTIFQTFYSSRYTIFIDNNMFVFVCFVVSTLYTNRAQYLCVTAKHAFKKIDH